ncbi:MAG: DNA replication/repair protein RecF [Clostridiales bacterium]|nr:DNA replication/repair protein RecF [Clostridiales bacterium]
MHISELTVADYRNYSHQTVRFTDKINFVVGRNAQGKTNLLEAVYLCSVGRSARTPRDKELINHDKSKARVRLTVKKAYGEDKVEIVLDRDAVKRISVNGMPISRIGELMGVVSTVFFSPDEMRIVKEAPSDRRRFMDIALCQMSRSYFYLLSRYNKILMQRNKLLKSGFVTDDALDIWDMQLVDAGAKIIKTRRGFVQNLSGITGQCHSYLTGGEETLVLGYESLDGETVEDIKKIFGERLKADRERDRVRGYTHAGPHKDDIAFRIGDEDIRSFGSQGQQRTASLALKLAEVELVGQRGEYPILLLDDVLSELDIGRQKRLMDKIKDYQTIITCTHIDPQILSEYASYNELKVENGVVL